MVKWSQEAELASKCTHVYCHLVWTVQLFKFHPCRDYPLLLIEEYMNQGDLLGVLKDARPSMPLDIQLTFAIQVADGMDYLASKL